MKSIWHTPDEKPEYGHSVVLFSQYGTTESMVWLDQSPWTECVEYLNVVKWARSKDLLALESRLATAVDALKKIEYATTAVSDDRPFWKNEFNQVFTLKEFVQTALKDIGE